jgi:hypothetical protein
MDYDDVMKRAFERIAQLRAEGKLPQMTQWDRENEPTALAFTDFNNIPTVYSESEMIEFSEWVSLNFPNQHNYLRALQKRSQGINVPAEKFRGYYTTKELLEKFKNRK